MRKIIKRAIKNTLNQIKEENLKIVHNTFFGECRKEPYNLVIWYFFETNVDWESAKNDGLIEKIEKLTISNLVQYGYPASAFEVNIIPLNEKHELIDGAEEDRRRYVHSMTHRKVRINFASKQDVDDRSNGNYFYYIK